MPENQESSEGPFDVKITPKRMSDLRRQILGSPNWFKYPMSPPMRTKRDRMEQLPILDYAEDAPVDACDFCADTVTGAQMRRTDAVAAWRFICICGARWWGAPCKTIVERRMPCVPGP